MMTTKEAKARAAVLWPEVADDRWDYVPFAEDIYGFCEVGCYVFSADGGMGSHRNVIGSGPSYESAFEMAAKRTGGGK